MQHLLIIIAVELGIIIFMQFITSPDALLSKTNKRLDDLLSETTKRLDKLLELLERRTHV